MSGSLVLKDLLIQAHTGEIHLVDSSCKTSQNVLNQPFGMCTFRYVEAYVGYTMMLSTVDRIYSTVVPQHSAVHGWVQWLVLVQW